MLESVYCLRCQGTWTPFAKGCILSRANAATQQGAHGIPQATSIKKKSPTLMSTTPSVVCIASRTLCPRLFVRSLGVRIPTTLSTSPHLLFPGQSSTCRDTCSRKVEAALEGTHKRPPVYCYGGAERCSAAVTAIRTTDSLRVCDDVLVITVAVTKKKRQNEVKRQKIKGGH